MIDALLLSAAMHAPASDRTPQPSRKDSAAVRFLTCVAHHESHGNPKAENPVSTASGIFQFLDGTWRHYAAHVPSARRFGHAAHAPAAAQWDVALLAVKWGGHGNWRGTHCGYNT